MSGLFSGILVNMNENNGIDLSLEDVRIEFNESFEVLNAQAAGFEAFCDAVDKLEVLNNQIQQNDGKADKGLIMFLNQNNDLAEALGISIDMENFNEVVVGADVCAACEGAAGSLWQAVKNFFLNIWEGIKNFFKNLGNMFRNTEGKINQIEQNSGAINSAIQAGAGATTGSQRLINATMDGKVQCATFAAFQRKIEYLKKTAEAVGSIQTVEAAVANLVKNSEQVVGGNLKELGFTRREKDGVVEYVAPNSYWGQKGDVVAADTVGQAFKKAGWTEAAFAQNGELRKQYNALREAIGKLQNTEKIIKAFIDIKDDAELQQKLGEGADAKNARAVGKVITQFISVAGNFMKFLDQISSDAVSLINADKAAAQKKAADDKAQAEQKVAEANAPVENL